MVRIRLGNPPDWCRITDEKGYVMPFIKDAKTGLPGYVIPDIEEEAQDQSPDPSIYGEPGVTAAEVKEVKEVWDAIESRVNSPGTAAEEVKEAYSRPDKEPLYLRELALRMAIDAGAAPEDVIKRAEAYLTFLKGETLLPSGE